ATALTRLGETDNAKALYRECLDIRRALPQGPDDKIQQINLAVALARCGEHEEAVGISRRLLADSQHSAEIAIEVACALALCAGATADPALKSRYTEETYAAIRDGCAQGWKDFERFRVDPDLDPVRGDPAFGRLIAEFQNPGKPTGR